MRHILRHAGGKRIAVIVNEFGELGIDGEILKGCGIGCDEKASNEGNLYELANGCLCCTVQEEFSPVMEKLVERREQIDHVLIETSGLALPKPLVQAFKWPQIRNSFTVDAVIPWWTAPLPRAASSPKTRSLSMRNAKPIRISIMNRRCTSCSKISCPRPIW